MILGASYRGQPVLALLLLAAGWTGARVMLWDPPFADPAEVRPLPSAQGGPALRPMAGRAVASAPTRYDLFEAFPEDALVSSPGLFREEPVPVFAGTMPIAETTAFGAAVPQPSGPTAIPPFPSMAGDPSRPPLPRWSGDAWVLLRNDTVTPVTSGRGSYGRSQAGAVLRYRLVPSSEHRPAAYLRVSTSIDSPREAEVALGVSARPIPSVPIVVAAEMRGARFAGDTQARAAAFAYSELPPVDLPFGARGEAYVQGGYVGGRYATPFIDGQVRVDRPIAQFGPAELGVGGGAWGGAQKGAKRLDVGPGATVALDVAGAPLRVSADWRFRIAGEANPSSGPALTVSAGF